jgi:hypothetical protein
MFIRRSLGRRSLGQYEEGDYESSYWSEIGSAWGVTPEQAAIQTAPIAGISIAPSTPSPSSPSGGGWLSNIFSSIIGGAAQVGSAYLMAEKKPGQVVYGTAAPTALTTVPVQQAGIGSIFSSSNLPILGIIGIGAFLVLRGRKKGKK